MRAKSYGWWKAVEDAPAWERRRAQVMATILLVLLVVMAVGILVRTFVQRNLYFPDLIVLGFTLLAYGSAKTRYAPVGAVLLILVMCAMALQAALKHWEAGAQDVTAWLVWLALPLSVVPLLFSWRMMLFVAPLPALFLGLFVWVVRPLHWGALLAVLVVGAVIAVAVAYVYDQDLLLLQKQNRTLHDLNEQLRQAYEDALRGWIKVLEVRYPATAGHSERVANLAVAVAQRLGLRDEEELRQLRYGAWLHDVGKLALPDTILLKKGPLTEKEKQAMASHTEYGYRWLKEVPLLGDGLAVVRYHHERWDGQGYYGLRGEAIPLFARIVAVVDVWDALRSPRPYRPAWPKERVVRYFQDEAGKAFDPRVVQALLEVISAQGKDFGEA